MLAASSLIDALATAAKYSCSHPLSGDLRAWLKLLRQVQHLHVSMETEWLSYPAETRRHVEKLVDGASLATLKNAAESKT